MKIRISVLIDNTVLPNSKKGLVAEEGLSCLVEYNGQTVLFGTGQTQCFAQNAVCLGKNLEAVSTVVLSHGHQHHTGGLPHLLRRNSKTAVLAHPATFKPKFSNQRGRYKSIGSPFSAGDLNAMGIRLALSEKPVRIGPGMITSGVVPLGSNQNRKAHLYFTQNGPDLMEDEQVLILDTPCGSIVIMGCAHRGVGNILDHTVRLSKGRPIYAVIGGMHLSGASAKDIDETIKALRKHGPKHIITGHCTGFEASARLADEFKQCHQTLGTGLCLEF